MALTSLIARVLAFAVVLVACGDDPKPDQAPPEIAIDSPTTGARVADPVTVTGTVKDARVKGRKTSGVASVIVAGTEATIDGERFSATLTGLSPGPLTIVAEATDKKGNVASASVDVDVGPPITTLHVEPPAILLSSSTAATQLTTIGFFEGTGASNITGSTSLTFESSEPTIVVVSATGVVTAASATANGVAEVTVRYGELSARAKVSVNIDTDPPGRPRVVGYARETNQRDQTWTGTTEPDVELSIAGGASATPLVVTADKSGRFWVNVPLGPNAEHAIAVTLTDANGNASSYDFPISQSDGFADAGTLYLSSVRRMTGFVGELVPETLVARAYGPTGAPLAGAAVEFTVFTGSGRLETGCAAVGGCAGASPAIAALTASGTKLTTHTDGAGYARARWTLGPGDYDEVEVHAALAGDVGFPVVFKAEGFLRLDQPTAVEGVVYDENRIPVVGLPVTLLTPGNEYASNTTGAAGVTDGRGRFRIAYMPSLPEPTAPRGQHIRLDGTAMAPQKYVRIDRLVTILPGQINDAGTFWVPRLPEGVAPKLDGQGVVTEEVVLEREVLPGNGPVRVRVPVGTKITWPGGVPDDAKKLALLAIPEIRAPMSLPDGFFSREVLALQPGGTRFEPPLPLDMPNSGNEPPGSALTMWSYDHFQSAFVPIGRGLVSDDGTRVVSEPGTGIRVGAWHKVTPPVPDPPCTATGQTVTTVIKGTPPEKAKKKYEKCKCYIEGTDQPTPCPEDKDKDGTPDKFVITNIGGCKKPPPPPPPPNPDKPKPPPPPPPVKKIEIVCETKPLQITQPTELISYVRKGDTVQFTAECLDNHKSDGSIKWQRSAPDPKSGTGPKFTIRFDVEGRFVVSASANTKTCKGNDQRTVVVKSCVDMGVVRTCGDKIEPFGLASDLRWKVSGNVQMGFKGSGSMPGSTTPNNGDMYLQIGAPMIVDPLSARPDLATTVKMEVGYPIVGPKLTPLIYERQFTVDATGLIKIQAIDDPLATPDPGKLAFRLLQFAFKYNELQMMIRGVYITNPYVGMMGQENRYRIWQCNKTPDPSLAAVTTESYRPPDCKPNEFENVQIKEAKDLQFVLDGIELNRDYILPSGVIEYKPKDATGKPGMDLGSEVLQLISFKAGFMKGRIIGELALQFNLKRFNVGIKTSLAIGEGYWSAALDATFTGAKLGPLELPGVPIVPPYLQGPVYLTSLGVTYESSSWPVSDVQGVKLTGRVGVTLGPTMELLGKKLALATGLLTGTINSYPLSFGLKGELTMLDALVKDSKPTTTANTKITGTFDVVMEPSPTVSMGLELLFFIPDLFGLGAADPTTGQARDPVLKGSVKGTLGVSPNDGALYGNIKGEVLFQIPKLGTRIPAIQLLRAIVSMVFYPERPQVEISTAVEFGCGPYNCTVFLVSDLVNGESMWMLDNAGDLVVIYGLHPNKRVPMPTAPSLGVTAETLVSVPYAGDPVNIELLEPAAHLLVTLEKSPGATLGTLTLPNGDVVQPVPSPIAEETRSGVDFHEGLDGRTASWMIYVAEPGTYTYRGPNDREVVHDVVAFIPAPPPQLTFEEPFEPAETGDDLTIRWTASGGVGDASLSLSAVPTDPVIGVHQASYALGTFAIAPGEIVVDEGQLPHGEYRIVAELYSQGGKRHVPSIGSYTIGEPTEPEANAPTLIEVSAIADDGAGGRKMTVSWLPVEGATRYLVTLIDDLGTAVVTEGVNAPGNAVTLRLARGSRPDLVGGGEVVVEAFGGTERVSASLDLPLEPAGIFAPPATAARVGQEWTYRAADEPTDRSSPVVILKGPPGIEVDDDGLMRWTPTEADLGGHELSLRFGAPPYEQTRDFSVRVLEVGAMAQPEPAVAPEARRIEASIATPIAFDADFQALDPIELTLVAGPDGATLEDGIVRWNASAAEVIAARGEVAFIVRATAAGLSRDASWVAHFADKDGDGLDDVWEIASGTDPEDADSGAGDPDDDGLDDREEAALRTRGDVADSDGDGLDDGDDAAPRFGDADGDGVGDGAEETAGTDPAMSDSDGDGVSDAVERANGTDPMVKADGDGDGVFDDREVVEATNASLADTDGDGLSDGEELFGYFEESRRCTSGSSPLTADTDGDGADDAAEARRCDGITSPTNAGVDIDEDGLRSDLERILGTLDGSEDTDGDGVLDLVEVAVGTDPASAGSKPDGVETEPTEPIANSGFSVELLLAPESLTDFGVIEVFPDADHDSAVDDYETQWQYDPESPADAYDDADGDFLPMWQESRLGTSPEAKDTDGDGVDDGVELQDGTDPNDPTSKSSAGPVTVLTSYPGSFDLRAHAFLGTARLQLEVVGTRADGSTVDLTTTARGTSYALEPTGAGTVDAAGAFTGAPGFTGTAAITVSNLALTSTTTLEITTFVPGPVASLPLGESPTALALGDGQVFVGGPRGVRVIDTSIIETPVLRGVVAVGGSPIALAANGNRVAAAVGSSVAIVDVTDPDAPGLVVSIPIGALAKGVAWAGQAVVVASGAGLVRVDPDAPGVGLVDADKDDADDRIVDKQAAGSAFADVAQDLDRVIAARGDGHLTAWRLVAGGLVQELEFEPGAAATRVVLQGGVVAAAGAAGAMRLVLGPSASWRRSAGLGLVSYVALAREFVLATDIGGTVAFLDARGEAPLTTLGTVDFGAFFQGGIAADERYFYLADGYNRRLAIGAHGALNDTLGVPPVVVPVSPLTGATIVEGTRLEVSVLATDDIGVKVLTLTRDGEDVVSEAKPTWTMSVKTGNVTVPATMTLGAYATDFGHNVGEMAPLVFEVTPIVDTVPPTITLLEPSAMEWVAADSPVLVAVRPEDDHAVWKVEIRLEGELVATLEDPPYATEIIMPADAPADGLLELEVRAYDYGTGVATESADLVFAGIDLVARGVTAIAADDTTYDDEDILIRRGTVAIDGAHDFGKVRVGRDGVLTHSDTSAGDDSFGLDLTVERVDVAPSAAIDVTARGYLGDCSAGDNSCGGGPHGDGNINIGRVAFGGGAHGGVGGHGGHATYGDWFGPTSHGGGGDFGSGGGEPGGDGGGRVRIVADAIVLDGVMRANGGNGIELNQKNGGGGAGGSIWISAGSLDGLGRIEANGGAPASAGNAAGGGGRIALELDDAGDFDLDLVRALPGPTSREGKGGAGTVYLDVAGARAIVIDDARRSAGVDDAALGWAASDVAITVPDLIVRGATRLVLTAPLDAAVVRLEQEAILTQLETENGPDRGLTLDAARLEITADASIDVTGRGYVGDCRPYDASCGGGSNTVGNAQGGAGQFSAGSHGGIGGGPRPNPSYGDVTAPVTLGTGGGYGSGGGEPGGDGGGKMRLVLGALVNDGRIVADGQAGIDLNQRNGGGGAGGSVWISAQSLAGSGVISANGGASASAGGSNGGGGRIAIEYVSGGFDQARVTAWPGPSMNGPGTLGTAGTVFSQQGAAVGTLVIDDGGLGAGDGRALGFAPSDTTLTLDVNLVLGGNTLLALSSPLDVNQLRLEGHSVLTHLQTDSSYQGSLTLTADLVHVGPDAAIDVTGRGYLGDCAPGDSSCGGGAHTIDQRQDIGSRQFGGGAHGGLGGANTGRTFGDPFAPVTLGGGGGYGNGGGEPGGDGGGRVRIIAERLEVEGAIRALGGDGPELAVKNGSGGAGGSIWVSAGTIVGAGAINANGGDSGSAGGMGGGGGRVALVYTTLAGFDPVRATAEGGAGVSANGQGGPGTVWLDAPGAGDSFVVDNGGAVNRNEAAPWNEVGLRSVTAKTAEGVEVAGTPWLTDSLVGAAVTIAGTRFTVTGNSANALQLSPASFASITVADRIDGERGFVGALLIRGASRVAVVDRIAVTDLTVASGAVLTHPGAGVGPLEPGLHLDVAEVLHIEAGAKIDVTGRGYLGDCAAGDSSCGGGAHTLGFAQGAARQFAGGSHGGLGGGGQPGFVYGDPLAPTTLGAGGGYGNGGGEPGGNGGGRIAIAAGTLLVDGAILAEGGAVPEIAVKNGSGAAGGSIAIAVQSLGGSGRISAAGSASGSAGGSGGGGGRVAVTWEIDAAGDAFDVDAIDVHGGASTGNAPGGPGSLWLTPAGVKRLVIDNGGTVNSNEAAAWPEIGHRTVASATSDSVNVGAGLILGAYVGYEVILGSAAARHTVVSNTGDTLVFQPADGNVAGTVGDALRAYFVVPGRVEILGGSRVALTDRVVADALSIDGAVLTHHRTNASGPDYGLWIELSGALTIAADGSIDVTARGYRGDCSAGSASCGGGAWWNGNQGGGARQTSGGSYGGLGGGPSPNAVYGDPLDTWLSGAGGGYGNGGGEHGGSGGGRVRLIVGSLVLGGGVLANGGAGLGTNAGGGAGGGIWITASQLTGAGAISARGGDAFPSGLLGGGGGGGRVHLDAPGAAGSIDVGGGASQDGARIGGDGTSVRD